MPFRQKLLLIVGIISLGVFIFIIFILPGLSPEVSGPKVSSLLPNAEDFGGIVVPENAFIPAEDQLTQSSPSTIISDENIGLDQVLRVPIPPDRGISTNIPSIEDIRRAVESALGTESKQDQLIELPNVPDSELAIDSDGAKEPIDYVEKFAVDSATDGIGFDNSRFAGVLMDENNLPLFPQQLVEKGLKDGNFAALKNSLYVFRDFIGTKSAFTKSIKVSGEAVGVAKELIAFDVLMLKLIDKAIAVADGSGSVDELRDFYGKFQATSDFRHDEFLRRMGIVAYKESGFFGKVAEFLGIRKLVFAQLPFGGPIALPIFCISSAAFFIPVGPPVPPPVEASLLASVAWTSSPLFFPFKSLRPGAFWLGTYSPVFAPCVQVIIPIGFGNIPIIAGTSP